SRSDRARDGTVGPLRRARLLRPYARCRRLHVELCAGGPGWPQDAAGEASLRGVLLRADRPWLDQRLAAERRGAQLRMGAERAVRRAAELPVPDLQQLGPCAD